MELRLTRHFNSVNSNNEALSFLLNSEIFSEFEQIFSENIEPIIYHYLRDQDYKLTESKMECINDFFGALSFESKVLLCSIGINHIVLNLAQDNCELKMSFNSKIKTLLDQKHQEMFYKNIKQIEKYFLSSLVWDQQDGFLKLAFKYKNERYV